MTIRIANPDDVHAVNELYLLCREEFGFPEKKAESLVFVKTNISNAHTGYVACFNDDGAIAYLSYSETISSAFMGKALNLVELYIRKEFRSQGIGGKVLDFFEKHLVENDFKSMFLVTMPHLEEAKNFYLKNGWTHENLVFFRKVLKATIA